jgi:predicted metal-dependent phosphoesterase TrpH
MGVADLHSHSRFSDGTLPVDALVALAGSRGVKLLALTDHDEVSGVALARQAAASSGMQLVSGVEISAEWQGVSVHIVGLRLDENDTGLTEALHRIRCQRDVRAQRMGAAFAEIGIHGVLEGARAYAPNPSLLSRTHFARHLVDSGVCSSVGEVFTRFMKPGKPGYVRHEWLPMETAISLIHKAGGRAVLAHPGRYETQAAGGKLALLKDFAAVGGDAVEVVCAAHHPPEWAEYGALARKFNLLASIGSDFHSPMESRVKFGDLPRLSPNLKAVWFDWPEAECLHA